MNKSGLRSSFLISVFILTFSLISAGQTQLSPTFVISGGYSGYNPGGIASGVRFGRLPMGWNTTAAVQFTPRYSFVTDFGGYSDSKLGSTHTFLAGPKFTFHKGPFAPFAEVMMGAQNLAPKGQASYIAFTEAAGGGVDVSIARRWSFRVVQADFIYAADHEKTSTLLNQFHGVRFSSGLVWNLDRPRRPVVAVDQPNRQKPNSDAPGEPTVATAGAPGSSTVATAAVAQPVESAAAVTAPEPVKAEAVAPETSKSLNVKETAPANELAKTEPATPSEPVVVSAARSTSEVAEKPDAKPEPVTPKPAKNLEVAKAQSAPSAGSAVEASTPTPAPAVEMSTPPPAPVVAASTPAAAPAVAASTPSAEPAPASVEIPTAKIVTAPAAPQPTVPAVQQVAKLRFPYDQYPSLLSTQDKRSLDALASRMKLEPRSKAAIVASAPAKSGSLAAQRAVNSKDYLVQKGIAADRIEALEQIPESKPTSSRKRGKVPATRTQIVFVPEGASFDRAGAITVDEQKVTPEHLHVAHPEWHEK